LTFDPDAYLESLEPFGWRLGLERMYKLTTALGMPQHRFASIHVRSGAIDQKIEMAVSAASDPNSISDPRPWRPERP